MSISELVSRSILMYSLRIAGMRLGGQEFESDMIR